MLDVAASALDHLDEGLVAVRRDAAGTHAVVVALHAGRAGRAETDDLDDLPRAARQARLRAAQPRAWPVSALPPAHVGEHRSGDAIATAVATTWGTRAVDAYDPFAMSEASAGGLIHQGPVVLAPRAVASVIAALRGPLGVDLALGGAPPSAGPAVTLLENASAFGGRALDAEGVPRRRVVLIDGGRCVSGVRDASSPPTTGHATRPLTLAPRPDHLVLVPGPTDDLDGPVLEAVARPKDPAAVLARVVAVGASPVLVALDSEAAVLTPAVLLR